MYPFLRLSANLAISMALVFVICTVSTPVLAQTNQSITGRVVDSVTGLPVAEVHIALRGGENSDHTNAAGQFTLHAIPPGIADLEVSRYGYLTQCINGVKVIEGFPRHIRVSLVPAPLRLPDREVESRRSHQKPGDGVRRYSRDEIIHTGHQSLADALDAIPGVAVYGSSDTPGGRRVSVGGERPHRVAVLYDGLPLASGVDGAVNLDAIPLSSVSEIEVVPGAQASVVGDAAIGGVVDIRTYSNDAERRVVLSTGQDSYYNATVTGQNRVGSLAADWALEHVERGDQFSYPSEDLTVYRTGTGQNSWRGSLGINPAPTSRVRLTGFYYTSDIGLPGALEQPTPQATNATSRVRLQGAWEPSPKSGQGFGAGVWYESSQEHFVSPQKLRNDTEVSERFTGLRAYHTSIIHGFGGRMEVEGRYRQINGEDYLRPQTSFGTHDRREFSLRTMLRRAVRVASHVVTASVSTAIDGDDLSTPFYTPRVDVGWSTPFGTHARVGWGKSFRRPLLTSLFWKTDAYAVGNPDLEPERAEEWDVGFGFRRGVLSLDSRYFQRSVDDMITWQRSTVSGQYKPLNVDRTRIVGREDHATLAIGANTVVVDYTHVFNGAFDHSSDANYFGETLVLSPRHTHDAAIALTADRVGMRGTGRWVSLRYIRRQNNPEKALAPYRVFDLNVHYSVRTYSPGIVVSFTISNATNEYYELLERYPAPGRTWSATTSVSF